MPWRTQLKGDSLSWVLEPDTSGVRYLALRDLLDLPAGSNELYTAERQAHTQGPIAALLDSMEPEGYWVEPGSGYYPKDTGSVWPVITLAMLGASTAEDERVATACEYLLDHALAEGRQFSISGAPSGTVDCLQGNLCYALTVLGCADPRLEGAFLAKLRLKPTSSEGGMERCWRRLKPSHTETVLRLPHPCDHRQS